MNTKLKIKQVYEKYGKYWTGCPELSGEFIDLIKKNSDKDYVVLDIGCGGGRLTVSINQFFKKIIAIDYSRNSIKNAKKFSSRKNIVYRVMDGERLNFAKESFDLVVSHAVINKEMCRAEKSLFQAYKVLKNNGKLIIKIVHKNHGKELGLNFGYTKQEIEDILEKIGYKSIKIMTIKKKIKLNEKDLRFFKRTEVGALASEEKFDDFYNNTDRIYDDSFMIVYAEKRGK